MCVAQGVFTLAVMGLALLGSLLIVASMIARNTTVILVFIGSIAIGLSIAGFRALQTGVC